MHVGGSGAAFLGFAAGAIPVYHGPHGAPEVFNREAVVIVDAYTSLREGLMRLRAAASDPQREAKYATAPALTEYGGQRWFAWASAMQGVATELAREAVQKIQIHGQGGPHLSCAADLRSNARGRPIRAAPQPKAAAKMAVVVDENTTDTCLVAGAGCAFQQA